MDAKLQLLKRQAQASGGTEIIWEYVHTLERLIGSGSDNSDLKIYQVLGYSEKFRVIFHCVAPDETSVHAQFEMALKDQPSWGSVYWNFQFEEYAGPVDGVEQPFHLLTNSPLPITKLSRYDNILSIKEVKLNTIREFC